MLHFIVNYFVTIEKRKNMVKSNENGAYKRGQELLDQGMFREAIEQFDVVIAEQPQSWKALNSKGFAFQKMSRIQKQ